MRQPGLGQTLFNAILTCNDIQLTNELKNFLLSLLAYKGLHIYETTIKDEAKAADSAAERNLDMDDAIQYSAALSTKADAIVAFDKHFEDIKIPRVEPHLATSK